VHGLDRMVLSKSPNVQLRVPCCPAQLASQACLHAKPTQSHPVRVMKLSAPSILAFTKLPKNTCFRSRSTRSWRTSAAFGPCRVKARVNGYKGYDPVHTYVRQWGASQMRCGS